MRDPNKIKRCIKDSTEESLLFEFLTTKKLNKDFISSLSDVDFISENRKAEIINIISGSKIIKDEGKLTELVKNDINYPKYYAGAFYQTDK